MAALAGVNWAVSECVATLKVVVLVWARPALTVTGAPIAVLPSKKVTVPVAEAGVSVAFRVTLVPLSTGPAGDTASVVVVSCALTVSDWAGEVEAPKLAGVVGTNLAVRECVPEANVEVDRLAVPLDTVTGEPSSVLPSRNWTAPAAVPGVTVAVSDTAVPKSTGPAGDTAREVVVVVAGAGFTW